MKTEPVTQKQLDSLIRSNSHLAAMIAGLFEIDLSKGRGILEGNDRCLWTNDKRRITIYAPKHDESCEKSLIAWKVGRLGKRVGIVDLNGDLVGQYAFKGKQPK